MNEKESGKVSAYRKRITLVYFFVLLLGLACAGKILYLVFAQGALYSGSSKYCADMTTSDPVRNSTAADDSLCPCFIRENTLRPVRGEIYDNCGRLLVGNYTVFEIAVSGNHLSRFMIDTLEKNPKLADFLITELSKNFYARFKDRFPNRTEDAYRNLFAKAIKDKHYVTVLPVRIQDEQAWITGLDTAFIKHLPCLYTCVDNKQKLQFNINWNFVPVTVRITPYGDMARRTLGMYNAVRRYGMEYHLNDVLAGTEGSKKYLEINHAVVPLKERLEPVDGYNIHTTLNLEIQNIVHNELTRKLTELNGKWGCAVIMEVETGEIKAISNLRRAADDGSRYTESMEYAIDARIEPGSTFKLASLLAYLEKIPDDNEHTYPMFNHTFKYPLKSGGYRQYPKSDSKVHDETLGTPDEIFQRSSNIGMGSMIFDAYGMKNFAAYRRQLAKLGIFDTLHTQLGDVMPATVKNGTNDFNSYYGTCFGAGFTMPIIRTLVYYNAIANNGRMMAPLFVKYITNAYDTVETFEPEVLNPQILSPSTIQKARNYLKNVVWGEHGTARHYKDPACPFAGKTGTRDIWNEKEGAYDYNRNSVSFCGYFPIDKPKYTAIVFINNVAGHSNLAVEVFSKIARNVMNNTNYGATHNVEDFARQPLHLKNPVHKRYFNTLTNGLGYDTTAIDSNATYLTVDGTDLTTQPKVKKVPNRTTENIPDVRHKIASDAVSELMHAGYKVTLHGRGTVTKQTVNKINHTVSLYLQPPN